MAILFARLNAPYDLEQLGMSPDGRNIKMCFFEITFDTVAVGAIAGQTYDPTNHLTTHVVKGLSPAKPTPTNLWGVTKIHRMVFFNGSSDVEVTGVATNSNTGECKAEYVESGGYFKLSVVGCGITGSNGVTTTEEEVTNAANNLSSLRFNGYLLGS